MPDLQRLVGIAHDRTNHLPHNTPMQALFNRAADAAEHHIDGDLGVAVAGVLALEAESLRVARWDSPLGRSSSTIFLALAVLDIASEGIEV